jgi:dihydrofolate synthase / folylpolyglutamate synthase
VNYESALEYISSLAPRGWRLGLDRMEEFARRAGFTGALGDGGRPQFLHIAGTNGKGSTTAMLQSCLTEIGLNNGSFFSPYVVDPRERVQLGRDLICKDDLAEITAYLKPIGESLSDSEFGGVTEFEFKTAIGFEFWRRKQCEWVALEVGLGGRLDATNIITPAVSAIVSIGHDHVNILGNTLAEIASEKAGILKVNRPGVVGAMAPEALCAIQERAEEVCSDLWRVGHEITYQRTDSGVHVRTPESEIDLSPSLFGEIQLHNAAVAYATLERAGLAGDPTAIQRGIASAYLPGRFTRVEYQGRRVILDGAHNADSAKVLARMLAESKKERLICITGMLSGHEPREFYEHLRPFVDEFWVVPVDFHRSRDATELTDELKAMGLPARGYENVADALRESTTFMADHEVLVTGSFYLVGDAMRRVLR